MKRAVLDQDHMSAPMRLVPGVAGYREACAATTSLALATWIVAGAHSETFNVLVVTGTVAALVVWIVMQDLKSFTIADGATASIGFLAVAYRWSAGDTAVAVALDCLLTGGVLLAFREIYYRRRGVDGVGLGDVKLAAAGGILIGANAFAWALMAASLLALGAVVTRRVAAGSRRIGDLCGGSERLAFGAVLGPAIWLAWLFQHAPVLFSLPVS